MLHKTPFDSVASTYDEDFTHTIIGKLQRERTHYYTQLYLPKNSALKILELNCGTGEDAIWLAQKGHQVLATDGAEKMIDIARLKNNKLNLNIRFEVSAFNELNNKFLGQQFDIIFSNFAGLNCINEQELKKLNDDFISLLKPNGKLIMVLLGKYSWMEKLYFVLKGDIKNANRRIVSTSANLGNDIFQTTWCYSVNQIKEIFTSFSLKKNKPIGIIIPPSYFNRLLKKTKILIPLIKLFEKLFSRFSVLSNYGDHTFIIMSNNDKK
jgi:ubiquinone/menaquinone biosynthesis C-methylase UbiE